MATNAQPNLNLSQLITHVFLIIKYKKRLVVIWVKREKKLLTTIF